MPHQLRASYFILSNEASLSGLLFFLQAHVGDDIREVTVKSQSLGNTQRI